MKPLLYIIFLITALSSAAKDVYPASELFSEGKKLNPSGVMVHVKERDAYWLLQDIAPGQYHIRLQLQSGHTTGIEELNGCFLYLNGKRIDFDSATPLIQKNDKLYYCEAQTPLIDLKSGDQLRLPRMFAGAVGALSLSQERLTFAPQQLFNSDQSKSEDKYRLTGSQFGEKLNLNIRNMTGSPRQLKIEVKVFDFFRNTTGEKTISTTVDQQYIGEFDYRKVDSNQYRAQVTISDELGNTYDEIFPYLRDNAAGYHKTIWLNRNWQYASVKDDGTLKTRTIQAEPPIDAKWRNTDLPTSYPNHIAWFKRNITIPPEFRNGCYLLHFDRLAHEADIYVNGVKAAEHRLDNWTAPFAVDISQYLHPEKENTLMLAVRGHLALEIFADLAAKNIVSMTGGYGMSQGIGEMWLECVPEKYIRDIKINTSFRHKTISVSADIPPGFRIQNRVFFQGRELLVFESGSTWETPILWGPNEFPLLQLITEMRDRDGKLVDVKNTRFGFREIWADGVDILWNGKKFRTVARGHFTCPWHNTYVDPRWNTRKRIADWLHDLKKHGIKATNHIFSMRNYADIADEEGIIYSQGTMTVAAQNEMKNNSDKFWKIKESNDKAMIEAMYNHPSIYTWYISNEYYGQSYDACFRRLKPAAEKAMTLDPARFVETGCDLDLRGTTQVVSTHYPVEMLALRTPQAYLPDSLYWRNLNEPFHKGEMLPKGQIQTVCNVLGYKQLKWGLKPLIINETCWLVFFAPPHGMTAFMGDAPYVSSGEIDRGHLEMVKMAIQGQRDADAAIITPWRVSWLDYNDYIGPELDLVIVQKYHSFFVGTQVNYDVNIFHDILAKGRLTLYWQLQKAGKVVQEHHKDLEADYCRTFREKITLDLKEAGDYELIVGIADKPQTRQTVNITVYKHDKCLAGNIITPEMPLNENLLERAKNGETIVLLSRKDYPEWLPFKPDISERDSSINYSFRPDHPILNGITKDELSYWYPNHLTGNGYFRKPNGGNAKTIIESGGPEGLIYSGVIEVPYGKGCFLFSHLVLDTDKNPIAVKLLKNMAAYKNVTVMQTAGFIGNNGSLFATYLKKYGIKMENADFLALNKYHTLLVDGTFKLSENQMSLLKAFHGKVFVHNPDEQYGVKIAPVTAHEWLGRAIRHGFFPETAGLTNGDFYYRNISSRQDPRDAFWKDLVLESLGTHEFIAGAEPMIYPVFLAKRGNMIFDNLNWTTENAYVSKLASRIITTLLTNLGVKVDEIKKIEIPDKLNHIQLDLTKFLDRTMTDQEANDGKGSWNDQGPEFDMSEFNLKTGVHTLAGIPFRIENPYTCFTMKSRYRKGGYDEVTIPVNRCFDALFFLHTIAWCSGQHHYSVIVNYDDGTQYEIKMTGKTNLTDWGFKVQKEFPDEIDTLTQWAYTVKQKMFTSATLYRTAWINPLPTKKVSTVVFKSMNKGRPMIMAVTLGVKENSDMVVADAGKDALYEKMLKDAGRLYTDKDYRRAISLYEKALRIKPEYPAPYGSIGACYEMLDDYENAIRTYEHSLAVDTNQPHIRTALEKAKNHLKQNNN